MRNRLLPPLLVVLVFFAALTCHAGGQTKSGLQVGESIPGSFHPFNINGPYGKKTVDGKVVPGRHHCLVCEHGLKPVALVFVRGSKDEMLVLELLKQLDKKVDEDKNSTFRTFAVFLDPWARDTVTEAALPKEQRITDPAKQIELLMKRNELVKRLEKYAEGLKNLVVTYYPDLAGKDDKETGPKGFKVSPQSGVTVILYRNFNVEANFGLAEGQMTKQNLIDIMDAVDEFIGRKKQVSVEK